jgi:hypothetical protein
MTDPFSIGGSAVGVVALGLTVCRGLFQYYSACRDSSADLKALVSSLDGLICTLEMFKSTINDQQFDSKARADIAPFIADCGDAVTNLERELDKVKKEPPIAPGSRLKAKLGNASKALRYPFRESTLKELQGFVGEVRENLSLAANSVNL